MRNIECQKCKVTFTCFNSENNCWCFEMPYLRLDETEQYKDCICKNCMLELYDARSKNNNKG